MSTPRQFNIAENIKHTTFSKDSYYYTMDGTMKTGRGMGECDCPRLRREGSKGSNGKVLKFDRPLAVGFLGCAPVRRV